MSQVSARTRSEVARLAAAESGRAGDQVDLSLDAWHDSIEEPVKIVLRHEDGEYTDLGAPAAVAS